MKTTTYLLLAIAVFVASITGSDLVARMTIAGRPIGYALSEHLQWISGRPLSIAFLFVPFGITALICGVANKRAGTRNAAALFSIALAVLAYACFDAIQAFQQQSISERWTGAAMWIDVLPIFVGLPTLLAAAIIAARITRGDPRRGVEP